MELNDKFVGEMIQQGFDEDMLYEDYAYSLDELHEAGINIARCDVYCAECEEEFGDIPVNTETFEWTCPKCGLTDDT